MVKRLNRVCGFFPCHKGLEDCTFCYCPFYPCADKGLGKYVYSTKRKKSIWSCKDCSWIHKKRSAERIYNLIRGCGNDLRNNTPLFLAERRRLQNQNIGVVILSHGSRLKKANALIPRIVSEIKQALGLKKIYPAFLQLISPGLSVSIKRLADRGCKKIIIVPFFLFEGNHVSRDIPEMIRNVKKRYPDVVFVRTKNLGGDPRMSRIVADKIREGMNGCNR